jgi:type IV pilus assembly protein PilW
VRPHPARRGGRHQQGVSLVELMVSILIGGLVVGALMATYLSTTLGARRQQALSGLADDAQLALALMRRDIQLAGSIEPDGLQPGGAGFTAAQPLQAVFGCDSGFADKKAAAGAGTCAAGSGSGASALELTYLATAGRAARSRSGDLVSCLGSSVTAGTHISSRWFVQNGPSGRKELYCSAPGRDPQPLVENVQALHLRYGVADGWQAANPQSRRPVRYLAASQLAAADWAGVVSVRICVLMRSPQPVLTAEDPASYIDCQAASSVSPDRHLYRSFATTVGIRNRGPF